MRSPQKLTLISILDKVTEKTAPGRRPTYGRAQVLKSLEVISSETGVGRQQLASVLKIGEGSTRTLIKRLRSENLIEVSDNGMALTSFGAQFLSSLNELLSSSELSEAEVTVGIRNYAILVRNASIRIKSGVEQRDNALLAGAKGATTLVYNKGRFSIPGMETEISTDLNKELLTKFKPRKGDVIIIGTADDLLNAELGAKAAALELIEQL